MLISKSTSSFIFYSSIIVIIFAFFHLFHSALTPFFFAIFLAYLNRPAVRFLEVRAKLSVTLSSLSIVIINLFIVVTLLALFIPTFYSQTSIFLIRLPLYQQKLNDNLHQFNYWLGNDFLQEIGLEAKGYILKILDVFFYSSSNILKGLWGYTLVTFKIIIDLIIIPIVLFYLLRDWHLILDNLVALIPKSDRSYVKQIMIDIDKFLRLYISGLVFLCFCMMCFYVIGLTLLRIDFSYLLGTMAGLAILFPFVGSMISIATGLLVTYITYGISNKLMMVMLFYLCGNFLENYILTPRIIGKSIGLHPAIILLTIFCAVELGSILYIILSIPFVGICNIFLRHLVLFYKKTELYK